jgi:uncharacterized protein
MSERDGYAPGVPCWVASVHSDPAAVLPFYTGLFGWEAEDITPPHSPARYFMCTLRGRKVAAVGTERDGRPPLAAAWGTHVWVESADEIAAHVTDAGGRVIEDWIDDADAAAGTATELGGRVIAPPFDNPVGRTAVLADPQGAAFSVSTVAAR